MPEDQLSNVLEQIDHCNAQDPNVDYLDGVEVPKELIYGQRMSKCLNKLIANPNPLLQIAVRAQHLERWKIKRSDYAMDRQGYRQWRVDCAAYHAKRVGDIMQDQGYTIDEIERVRSIVRKENIKSDDDAQALEDCAALVFLNFYFDDFIADHDDYSDEKMVKIIQRTWKKMSEAGHQAALKLDYSSEANNWLKKALG